MVCALFTKVSFIFTDLQRACNELKTQSQTTCHMLLAFLEKLQKLINMLKGEKLERVQYFTNIFYSIECVWHLWELMFIKKKTENLIVKISLDWVRFHFLKLKWNAVNMINLAHEATTTSRLAKTWLSRDSWTSSGCFWESPLLSDRTGAQLYTDLQLLRRLVDPKVSLTVEILVRLGWDLKVIH